MNWTDEELDKLFSDSAGDVSFTYKKDYFKDIEKHLPISRKRDFLWNGISMAMGAIIVYLMIQPGTGSSISADQSEGLQLASTDMNTEVQDVFNLSIDVVSENVGQTTTSGNLIQHSEELVAVSSVDQIKTESIESNGSGLSLISKEINSEKSEEEISSEKLDQLGLTHLSEKVLNSTIQPSEIILDRIDLTPRMDWYVQGITGLGQGRMLPGEKNSKVFGVGAGVEYNRNHLMASMGINGVVSQHEGMELSRISKVYGFGSTEYKSTIEYSKLFLLESDLTLGYRTGRFAAFGGMNLSYLVTTECSITNTDELKDMADTDVRKEYGYKTGLKNWGIKPMVGASYDFKNKLQLGMNLGAQVLQTVDPQYLEGVSRPMPIEGRIYLRWKL